MDSKKAEKNKCCSKRLIPFSSFSGSIHVTRDACRQSVGKRDLIAEHRSSAVPATVIFAGVL